MVAFLRVTSHIILCIVILIFSDASGQIIITGQLQNSVETTFLLRSSDGLFSKRVAVDDGKISESIQANAGYYTLNFSKDYAELFFSGNGSLQVDIDAGNFDESLQFSGTLASDNNFLAQSYLRSEESARSLTGWDTLTEHGFLHHVEKFYNYEKRVLTECGNCSELFKSLHKHKLDFDRAKELHGFHFTKAIRTGSKPSFSNNPLWGNPFEGFNLNDPGLIGVPGYMDVIRNILEPEARKLIAADSTADYSFVTVRAGIDNISDEQVRERYIFSIFRSMIDFSKDRRAFYDLVVSAVKNPAYLEECNKIFGAYKKLDSGLEAPDFEFTDMNGKMHKLSDFRGKYVLIDLWATWCMPCLAEVPHLNKLHSEIDRKDLELIGIAWRDDKNKWLEKVRSEGPAGLQLFAEIPTHEFFDQLVVKSIPRYIIIGKDGKVINPDAPRPSDPKLKALLLGLKSSD